MRPDATTSTEAAARTSGAASVVGGTYVPMGSDTLNEGQWQLRRANHEARVDRWTEPLLHRRSLGIKDPVEDFLFDYYPYSPAQLRRWGPGQGRVLLGRAAQELAHRPGYHRFSAGVVVDVHEVPAVTKRLAWVRELLRRTADRGGAFHCFGMHEWAMVHGQQQHEVRHRSLPLRVTPEAVRDTVDAVGLRCTHYDAYRFFTSSARRLNETTPTRDAQPSSEQAGCLHATMDLYKFAMWLDPTFPAELKADAFDLARRCRMVDMQASPYDVSVLGLEPIEVETPSGRARYAERQRTFADEGQRLRRKMLAELDRVEHPTT